MGPAALMGAVRTPVVQREIGEGEAEVEWGRFQDAVSKARESIHSLSERLRASGAAEASILDSYVEMLGDELMAEGVERRIFEARQNVEWAIWRTTQELFDKLADVKDPYLVERRHDIAFVGERLLRAVAGAEEITDFSKLSRPSVVVAEELSPADTATMDSRIVLAMVVESGTRTSHTAIMARALEIPAVVGVSEAFSLAHPDELVIVDGFRGEVTIGPSPEMVAAAEERAERHAIFLQQLREERHREASTSDGTVVQLRANVELSSELPLALEEGAEGIGLYRTELLYLDRMSPPSEDEQYEIYKSALQAFAPRPVSLRTFDIGGDKIAQSLPLSREDNPALGLRAIRLALSQPELFLTQLRAMVRASAWGDLRILLPMVTTLNELRRARELLDEAIRQVSERGQAHAARIPLGVMVEVPSVAIMIDAFAREADFLSLGTNDLTQYALAVDRTSRSLADLASPFEPALIQLIARVIASASEHGTPLSLCGTMASDPLAAILLVGLGLRDLSMEAASLPTIKEALRRVSLKEAEAVAEEARARETAQEIEGLLHERFGERLGELVRGE